MVTMMVWW